METLLEILNYIFVFGGIIFYTIFLSMLWQDRKMKVKTVNATELKVKDEYAISQEQIDKYNKLTGENFVFMYYNNDGNVMGFKQVINEGMQYEELHSIDKYKFKYFTNY